MRAYNLLTNKINRSLNIVDFSKNTYISTEYSINHLQSNNLIRKHLIRLCFVNGLYRKLV